MRHDWFCREEGPSDTAITACRVGAAVKLSSTDGLWIRDVFVAQRGDLESLTDGVRGRPDFRGDERCGVSTLWAMGAVVVEAETIVRIAFNISQECEQQPIIVCRAIVQDSKNVALSSIRCRSGVPGDCFQSLQCVVHVHGRLRRTAL